MTVAVVLMLSGCGNEDPAPTEPSTGRLTLRFSVTSGVRANPALVDPLSGTVHGACFEATDVSLMGPREGAPEVLSVELAGVDLTQAEVSTKSFATGPIAPGDYVFLGMFDVDGNAGAPDAQPDPGDPVTLPSTNELRVDSGQQAEARIVFDLVY